MKYSIEYLILGSMVTTGIALTAYGGRQLQRYLGDILLSASTSPPPGLMAIIIGASMLGFSLGHITAEMKLDDYGGDNDSGN